MTKRKHVSPEALDASLLPKQRKPIPHAFVLDAISSLSPYTRPMFGCLAIYVKDKIVLILRDKPKSSADNGVWLATTQEHHQSLRHEFPNMRSIQVLGKRVTGWQVLPVDAPDFESAALRACELVLAGDARIGKIPGARTSKPRSRATGRSSKQIKTSKKHGSTINFDTVRKIGLALPGVEESTAYGSPALKVRGKLLACVPAHGLAEPGSLVVRVGFDDRAELLAADPDVYYVTDTVVESLMLDLLDWLAKGNRSYEEVMDAWRTSCPRLPVWEEANDRSLVIREDLNGRCVVRITSAGRDLLVHRDTGRHHE